MPRESASQDYHGGDMSKEEAKMLLEGHEHEEEETGDKMKKIGASSDDVLKNW